MKKEEMSSLGKQVYSLLENAEITDEGKCLMTLTFMLTDISIKLDRVVGILEKTYGKSSD